MAAPAPKVRRTIFEQLGRDILAQGLDASDVAAEHCRSIESHYDAVARWRRLDLATVRVIADRVAVGMKTIALDQGPA